MRPSLLSAVALTIVALYALPAAAQDNQTQDTAEVEFEDQTMDGNMVVVARVVLPEGGFVVIHDTSQDQTTNQDDNQSDQQDQQNQDTDNTQNIVGSSEYLEAGEHTDVEIDVSMTGTTGTGDDTGDTGTNDEKTLTAMLHMDTNNNQEFDFEDSDGQDDGPYMEGGTAVTDEARVTMQTGDDGLDQPGDDGFGDGQDDQVGDGQDDQVGDGEEDTPGFEAVALLALLGAVAVFRRR